MAIKLNFTPTTDHPLVPLAAGGVPVADIPVPRPEAPVVEPSSLTGKGIVVANDREGGHKYFEAMGALESVLSDNASCVEGLEQRLRNIYDCTKLSPEFSERRFLLDLSGAIEIIRNHKLPIRDRNEQAIALLRKLVESPFYQMNKDSNEHCDLLQQLCLAKITKVYPYETFRELISNAVTSADPKALDGLENINQNNAGYLIRSLNKLFDKVKSRFKKSFFALLFQNFRGEFGGKFGVRSDPGKSSNVPYVRSRFTRSSKSGPAKEVTFCRFGNPTIQDSSGTRIDPIFLGTLDAMKKSNQQFLYVNHQKLHGREGVRVTEIKALEGTYDNFHFLSIPLDGEIVDLIRDTNCSIGNLKNIIRSNFINGINGCVLPKNANISGQDLDALLEHVHSRWFPKKELWTTEELEAFWGIFNTLLKHKVIQKLDIDVMNASCKDNKDRGGTLSTIDEAVRNVLLGRHANPEKLKELVFNALAPYMIKLEHILDVPEEPNHHRLGFLVSVLNHIATLTGEQIGHIKEDHKKLCFDVRGQEVPKLSLAQVPQSLKAKEAPKPPQFSKSFFITNIFRRLFGCYQLL